MTTKSETKEVKAQKARSPKFWEGYIAALKDMQQFEKFLLEADYKHTHRMMNDAKKRLASAKAHQEHMVKTCAGQWSEDYSDLSIY